MAGWRLACSGRRTRHIQLTRPRQIDPDTSRHPRTYLDVLADVGSLLGGGLVLFGEDATDVGVGGADALGRTRREQSQSGVRGELSVSTATLSPHE